jgi:hypothetical protein
MSGAFIRRTSVARLRILNYRFLPRVRASARGLRPLPILPPPKSAGRRGPITHASAIQTWGLTAMPRPRKPLALAKITGSYAKDPGRYRGRNEPLVIDPVGDPPEWLTPSQADSWRSIVVDMPWLNSSHVGITGIAAILVAKMATGELGIPGMQLLRVTLGQMGGTPADFPKVNWSSPVVDEPGAEFFR